MGNAKSRRIDTGEAAGGAAAVDDDDDDDAAVAPSPDPLFYTIDSIKTADMTAVALPSDEQRATWRCATPARTTISGWWRRC